FSKGTRALKAGEVFKLEARTASKERTSPARTTTKSNPEQGGNFEWRSNGGTSLIQKRISQSKYSIRESLFAVNFRAAPCARESMKMRFIIPLQGLSEVHGPSTNRTGGLRTKKSTTEGHKNYRRACRGAPTSAVLPTRPKLLQDANAVFLLIIFSFGPRCHQTRTSRHTFTCVSCFLDCRSPDQSNGDSRVETSPTDDRKNIRERSRKNVFVCGECLLLPTVRPDDLDFDPIRSRLHLHALLIDRHLKLNRTPKRLEGASIRAKRSHLPARISEIWSGLMEAVAGSPCRRRQDLPLLLVYQTAVPSSCTRRPKSMWSLSDMWHEWLRGPSFGQRVSPLLFTCLVSHLVSFP
ncbi:hypothetical protein CVT26_016024, partial [Gymnopilus dilepis]